MLLQTPQPDKRNEKAAQLEIVNFERRRMHVHSVALHPQHCQTHCEFPLFFLLIYLHHVCQHIKLEFMIPTAKWSAHCQYQMQFSIWSRIYNQLIKGKK